MCVVCALYNHLLLRPYLFSFSKLIGFGTNFCIFSFKRSDRSACILSILSKQTNRNSPISALYNLVIDYIKRMPTAKRLMCGRIPFIILLSFYLRRLRQPESVRSLSVMLQICLLFPFRLACVNSAIFRRSQIDRHVFSFSWNLYYYIFRQ